MIAVFLFFPFFVVEETLDATTNHACKSKELKTRNKEIKQIINSEY